MAGPFHDVQGLHAGGVGGVCRAGLDGVSGKQIGIATIKVR